MTLSYNTINLTSFEVYHEKGVCFCLVLCLSVVTLGLYG